MTAHLPAVSLEEVLAVAALQTRVDRKYVVTPQVVEWLTTELADRLSVLEIEGLRTFRYESVYFDTDGRASYRGAAHGHRRRFKVRTRAYLDSDKCVLEVKTRGGRDETVKHRIPHRFADRNRLTAGARAFIDERAVLPGGARRLAPTLTTAYQRTTLLDTPGGSRLTCDTGLICTAADGATVSLPGRLLIETKSAGPPTAADRLLWAAGLRPESFSKYCVGLAVLEPALPANRWNRTLRRHFHRLVTEEAAGSAAAEAAGAQALPHREASPAPPW